MDITTKFDVGQPIYFLRETAINYGVIENIEIEVYPRERCEGAEVLINYKLKHGKVMEQRAFSSKKDLLEYLDKDNPVNGDTEDYPF